jgi:hypothetical protein
MNTDHDLVADVLAYNVPLMAPALNPDEVRFVTVPEAARRLGRSKLSLYQACGRGEVPGAFKIGAKWLVNWNAFVKATESARGLMVEQE